VAVRSIQDYAEPELDLLYEAIIDMNCYHKI